MSQDPEPMSPPPPGTPPDWGAGGPNVGPTPPPRAEPPPPPIRDSYGPPPRAGKPWWVWVLGGCGGCLVIVIIATVALGVMGKRFWDSVSVGPVTPAAVQQALGDVPLYPDGKINTQGTEILTRTFRLIERGAGKPAGSIFKGLAILETADAPDKILAFYKQRLTGSGWKLLKQEDKGRQVQQTFRKEQQLAIVSTQAGGSGTVITVMTGGPELAQHAGQIGSSPGGSQ